MKQVSIKDIKESLSEFVDRASRGEPVLITRHNRPVAILRGVAAPELRIGTRIGRGHVTPLFRRATKGTYLAVLEQDRQDR